jgi:hypothetical protein
MIKNQKLNLCYLCFLISQLKSKKRLLTMLLKKRIIYTSFVLLAILASKYSFAQTVEVSEESFKCLTDMTPVRGFFVDNLTGDLQATIDAAKAVNGAVYPVGSVVQLVPTEVMVKREKGYNAVTKDWEFFELDVSDSGSKIKVRGAFEVVNKFGGNCFGCHIKAKPQWDMICEQDHGCDPITLPNGMVLTQDMIKGVQKTDPRCVTAAQQQVHDALVQVAAN